MDRLDSRDERRKEEERKNQPEPKGEKRKEEEARSAGPRAVWLLRLADQGLKGAKQRKGPA
jgi:hypothetical protein